MSSYLQRLLDTGSPSVSIAPVPQSTSPIAEADQRLLTPGVAPPASFAPPQIMDSPAPTDALEVATEQTPLMQEASEASVPVRSRPDDRSENPVTIERVADAPPASEEQPRVEDPLAETEQTAGRADPPPLLEETDTSAPPDPAPRPDDPPDDPIREDRVIGVLHREVIRPATAALDPVPDPAGTEPPETVLPTSVPEAVSVDPNTEAPAAVEPAVPTPPPMPAPPEPVVERQIERVVERRIERTEVEAPDTPPPAQTAGAPRTAASLSKIGPLPHRQKLRRINGLRWR